MEFAHYYYHYYCCVSCGIVLCSLCNFANKLVVPSPRMESSATFYLYRIGRLIYLFDTYQGSVKSKIQE